MEPSDAQRSLNSTAYAAHEIADACGMLARATTALAKTENAGTVDFLAGTVSSLADYLETLRNELLKRTEARHVLAGTPVVVGMTATDAKRWAERYAEQTAHVMALSTVFGAVHAATVHKSQALNAREKHAASTPFGIIERE